MSVGLFEQIPQSIRDTWWAGFSLVFRPRLCLGHSSVEATDKRYGHITEAALGRLVELAE